MTNNTSQPLRDEVAAQLNAASVMRCINKLTTGLPQDKKALLDTREFNSADEMLVFFKDQYSPEFIAKALEDSMDEVVEEFSKRL